MEYIYERLVKRGEFYLSLDFIKSWDRDLVAMNAGKRGHPFRFPLLFIEWMTCIHIFLQMPYRQMEGFTCQLATFIPVLKPPDYTTLFRRIQRMNIFIPVNPAIFPGYIVVAVDSTGLKVTNRGEWMREKWKVRRGWIKVHALIDVETNQILGLEVIDETTQDDQVFEVLLDQAEMHCDGLSPKSVLGDGAYDRRHCFNELEKRPFVQGSSLESMRHDDRGDPRIELNAFGKGTTGWQ